MIGDKIVSSVTNKRLKERLLREPNLTLEKVIDACRAVETARAQIQAMDAPKKELYMQCIRIQRRIIKKTVKHR